MAHFFNLAIGAFFGLAFLAPLTWPFLIAAGFTAFFREKRANNGLSQNRTRLVFAALAQGLPSVVILIYGAMKYQTGAPDDLILISLLTQLPIILVFVWWCRRAWPFALAMGLVWAAYSIGAAYVATPAISIRGNL